MAAASESGAAAPDSELEHDKEEAEKAAKFMQKCYRGRLGRSRADAYKVEVQMRSRVNITHADDDEDTITHINEYEVGKILGQGAYGIVYKAFSPTEQGDVAIKVLNRSVLGRKKVGKGTALDSVFKEIGVMKQLRHPNCVQLYEVIDDIDHHCMYLVMEFVAGGDLNYPITQKQTVTEDKMRRWMRDSVVGLEHLHSYNILHRDIKPENILWDEKNQMAKLADFGVSSISEGGQHKDYVKATAGTPAFFAPEMCGDDKTGAKVYSGRAADVWALGVCVYMWMFHKLPFEAPTVFMLMQEIKDGELVIPDTYPATAELLALLRGLLAKKPRHRLRIKDLRRDAWMTHDHAEPLPVPAHLATSHATVHLGELREILQEAVVQLRGKSALEDVRRETRDSDAGEKFHERNKQVQIAPKPQAAAARPRGPGMLKRAA